MRSATELEQLFDISPERIEEIDENARKGTLEGEVVATATGPGRPPLFDGPMQQVTFKEPSARILAIDMRAEQLGMKRSEYLRQLVENDLRCAGMA